MESLHHSVESQWFIEKQEYSLFSKKKYMFLFKEESIIEEIKSCARKIKNHIWLFKMKDIFPSDLLQEMQALFEFILKKQPVSARIIPNYFG